MPWYCFGVVRALLPLIGGLVLAGCNGIIDVPTFAPLARGAHYGAPARLTEGQIELSGTAAGEGTPSVGGPRFGLAIRDGSRLNPAPTSN